MNEIDFLLRRGDARFRFLLESMKDVNSVLKPHSVNRTPCVAIIRRGNLKNAAPAKSLQRLRRRIDLPSLGGVEGLPISDLTGRGNDFTSLREGPIHRKGLIGSSLFNFQLYIYTYPCQDGEITLDWKRSNAQTLSLPGWR